MKNKILFILLLLSSCFDDDPEDDSSVRKEMPKVQDKMTAIKKQYVEVESSLIKKEQELVDLKPKAESLLNLYANQIDTDSQSLKALGITPPDVTKELQSGDIDGARKKMSEVVEKNLKSQTAWMKVAVDFMKKNPGKAIPRELDKSSEAVEVNAGNLSQKWRVRGAVGLITNIVYAADDALYGDYLSKEEAIAERQKFEDLCRLAEQYRDKSRGVLNKENN